MDSIQLGNADGGSASARLVIEGEGERAKLRLTAAGSPEGKPTSDAARSGGGASRSWLLVSGSWFLASPAAAGDSYDQRPETSNQKQPSEKLDTFIKFPGYEDGLESVITGGYTIGGFFPVADSDLASRLPEGG